MSARGNNSTASTVKVLTLTLLLTACASAQPSRVAPTLSDPPAGAIEALAAASRTDPSVGAWIVDLDKFYQKQDVVKNGG